MSKWRRSGRAVVSLAVIYPMRLAGSDSPPAAEIIDDAGRAEFRRRPSSQSGPDPGKLGANWHKLHSAGTSSSAALAYNLGPERKCCNLAGW